MFVNKLPVIAKTVFVDLVLVRNVKQLARNEFPYEQKSRIVNPKLKKVCIM